MDSLQPDLGVQRERGARPALRPLHAAHVGEIARELAALAGSVLRDVAPFPPRDLLLVFEPPAPARGVLRVLLSADADWPRVHLLRQRALPYDGPPGPLCVAARAELVGLVLTAVAQPANDRLLALVFKPPPGAPGPGAPRTLLAELVPHHPNLVLLGGGERVLELLVPAQDPGTARLAVGRPYAPPAPPRGPARGPARVPPPGPRGPAGVPRGPEPEPLAQAYGPLPDPGAPFPLSLALEAAFAPALEQRGRERAARELGARLAKQLNGARGLLAGLAARAQAASESPRLREDAELLKSNLAAVRRGAAAVEVPDYFAETEGAMRRIALDPKLAPRANLERLFAKAEKLERSVAELERNRAALGERIAELERRTAELAALAPVVGSAGAIEALERELLGCGLLAAPQAAPERRAAPAPRVPYKTYRALGGSEIRVGRTAKDNDELSFKHCRGNDLWLHTADAPGSHVVLRLDKGAEPDEQELLDAAHLALHFSPLAGASRAGITVCRAKDLRKPRGAKPGLVSVANARRLELRCEPARLERLLARAPGASPDTSKGG